MSSWQARPTHNPDGQSLGADDLQIAREARPHFDIGNTVSQAIAWVQERPVETLILSFAAMIFQGGGGGGFQMPNQGGGRHRYGGYDGVMDGLGSLGNHVAGNLGGFGDALGGAANAEVIGMVVVAVVVGLFIGLIRMFIGVLVKSAADIYWLRLIRGQSAELPDVKNCTKFYVKALITTLIPFFITLGAMIPVGGLVAGLAYAKVLKGPGIAVFGGGMALIVMIPIMVLAIGWSMSSFIVVDKNIGGLEALKASWRLTSGYKGHIFLAMIVVSILNFLGILACCIGVIASNAVGMGVMASIYDRLAEPGNAYLQENEDILGVFE